MMCAVALATSLDELPAELPQVNPLRFVVNQLAGDDGVRAVWLGGSFAAGCADRYSDVDLRIAVKADQLNQWRTPDWTKLFDRACVGAIIISMGDDAFLHHIVLDDGTIFDLFVQSTGRDHPEKAIKILLCRDDEFSKRLERFDAPAAVPLANTEPSGIQQLLLDFWIVSHKHRKVLSRKLYLLATTGIHYERMIMLRLWEVLVVGRDGGGHPSIHGLSVSTRKIEAELGSHALEIFGLPLRTPAEICGTIEANRDEVARVGRVLTASRGMDYPAGLENTVRSSWSEFRREEL